MTEKQDKQTDVQQFVDRNGTPLMIGNVVRLNSGGPKMTIKSINQAGTSISCVWFDINGHVCNDNFNVVLLTK
jgi:uncharacterized protein YodC (DUF2158 family)